MLQETRLVGLSPAAPPPPVRTHVRTQRLTELCLLLYVWCYSLFYFRLSSHFRPSISCHGDWGEIDWETPCPHAGFWVWGWGLVGSKLHERKQATFKGLCKNLEAHGLGQIASKIQSEHKQDSAIMLNLIFAPLSWKSIPNRWLIDCTIDWLPSSVEFIVLLIVSINYIFSVVLILWLVLPVGEVHDGLDDLNGKTLSIWTYRQVCQTRIG